MVTAENLKFHRFFRIDLKSIDTLLLKGEHNAERIIVTIRIVFYILALSEVTAVTLIMNKHPLFPAYCPLYRLCMMSGVILPGVRHGVTAFAGHDITPMFFIAMGSVLLTATLSDTARPYAYTPAL